ncbi:hypothetical protein C8R45DRAFT_1104187 [Mycena sanguinolenta]|nr:hypothetical protein C8R45DRAFT_1104187 [Mycena sanguinolenta]
MSICLLFATCSSSLHSRLLTDLLQNDPNHPPSSRLSYLLATRSEDDDDAYRSYHPFRYPYAPAHENIHTLPIPPRRSSCRRRVPGNFRVAARSQDSDSITDSALPRASLPRILRRAASRYLRHCPCTVTALAVAFLQLRASARAGAPMKRPPRIALRLVIRLGDYGSRLSLSTAAAARPNSTLRFSLSFRSTTALRVSDPPLLQASFRPWRNVACPPRVAADTARPSALAVVQLFSTELCRRIFLVPYARLDWSHATMYRQSCCLPPSAVPSRALGTTTEMKRNLLSTSVWLHTGLDHDVFHMRVCIVRVCVVRVCVEGAEPMVWIGSWAWGLIAAFDAYARRREVEAR